MSILSQGDRLPEIVAIPPGPRSRELARKLERYESPNVTFITDRWPIFWKEAAGANVLDVDGNVYLDLTGGFGVAAAGHRNPAVTGAIAGQLEQLAHGLGDVHPPDIKVQLLERLAAVTPGELGQAILACSGAEAVEAALKTARLATRRPGVLCFTGAYHGLTYGALSVTDREHFRGPFEDQLGLPIVRAPFPNPYRPPRELEDASDLAGAALESVEKRLRSAAGERVGAVILEPILGRGGVVVPPDGFLGGLSEICDRQDRLLILDEVLTGFGRTGRWFACQHEGVVPDLLCLGKAASGTLPLSACIGSPRVMAAWPPSTGEAIHTSTFLGHPLACAAALAQIEEIEKRDLVRRADRLGERLRSGLRELAEHYPVLGDVRGKGLLLGLEIVRSAGSSEPDPGRARSLIEESLRRGILLLASGGSGNIISLTPPLTVTEEQLDFTLNVLRDCLAGR